MKFKNSRFLLLAGILALTLALVTYQVQLLEASSPAGPVQNEIPCEAGMAGIYPCDQVDFLSFLGLDELGTGNGFTAANLWGWTDPQTDKEYVLLGMTDTLAILDVSDPVNPVQVGHLPNQTSAFPDKYRDVKVYGNYAYIIADQFSNHGMQVFDLTQVRNNSGEFTATAHFDGFGNAHNLFINEDTGYAYVVRTTDPSGPDPCGGSVYMVDLSNPLAPAFAGCFAEDQGPASDSMCVLYDGPDVAFQGREICIIASDDNIIVGDVTDKANPTLLADLTYDDATRAHLAWFTEDHQYFVSADMNDEIATGNNTRIFLWDITQVAAPTLVGIYEGDSPASDHNVWVAGDYAYIGNFRAGMRILDLSDIAGTTMTNVTVFEAAYFDMYPADDNTGHMGGAWAIYPYFGSGIAAVSEREAGLYLLRPNLEQEPTDVSLVGLDSVPTPTGAVVYLLPVVLTGLLALGWALARKRAVK
jgi:choice-of-anchor B domain-containing protein